MTLALRLRLEIGSVNAMAESFNGENACHPSCCQSLLRSINSVKNHSRILITDRYPKTEAYASTCVKCSPLSPSLPKALRHCNKGLKFILAKSASPLFQVKKKRLRTTFI